MNAINWTENAEKKLAEYKEDIIEMIEAGLDKNKAIELIRKESTINETLFNKMIEEIKMKQENKVTVPCAKCFEACLLGEFEILDGSSVRENCYEIDFKNNRSQYMNYLKNFPLYDPRD